ncbi:acyl-CoA thioesterase [Branchiibius cervicis]|uniref:Acyl-CoA thioesterase n=1 Tax=Branchiibius cervicis TaxID=908252 RepID=A0ABW2AQF9_9MICO
MSSLPPSDDAAPSAADTFRQLLEVLDLKPAGSWSLEVSDTTGAFSDGSQRDMELFVGTSQPTPQRRAFGGQVLAQTVMAGGLSVRGAGLPDRRIHSLHAYFIRPGDSSAPINFAVENLRDGNSFSQRRVHALQGGQTILSGTLSFQEPAEGLDHQAPMPAVPDPERVWTAKEELDGLAGMHPAVDHWINRAVDVRTVEGALYFKPGRQHYAGQNVWMKAVEPLPDDPLIHAAVLAYASDYTLLEPVLRRHGLVWADKRLRPASLDHSMWFHRPARIDEWVLYTQESPSASGGRGLGIGKIFAQDGTLACTVAQEGMVRIKQDTAKSRYDL